jgi:D-hexose-6-phosphate mutarotase
MEGAEFKVGDKVTLDRYNHIDDVEKVEVVGYGEMPISKTLTYKMDVRGVIIESTGGSIMESKLYSPVPDEDRHMKKGVFGCDF